MLALRLVATQGRPLVVRTCAHSGVRSIRGGALHASISRPRRSVSHVADGRRIPNSIRIHRTRVRWRIGQLANLKNSL